MEYTVYNSADPSSITPLLEHFYLPPPNSHKGQNGKLMIIGGSPLFHSAVIWSAEIASYFVDMVHFSSTPENNEVMKEIKKRWQSGIVVSQKDISSYIVEDDAVLMGTGMEREGDEGNRTREFTKKLLEQFPEKKWILDAGSIQTMDKEWLSLLKETPVLTPHQKEFSVLFKRPLPREKEAKISLAQELAKQYRCVILLKSGYDIVTDGNRIALIEGGNAGLTKGGTGDILAGLTAAFATKNKQFDSAVLASYVLKATADSLYKQKGYWYNNTDIIHHVSEVLFRLHSSAIRKPG